MYYPIYYFLYPQEILDNPYWEDLNRFLIANNALWMQLFNETDDWNV